MNELTESQAEALRSLLTIASDPLEPIRKRALCARLCLIWLYDTARPTTISDGSCPLADRRSARRKA